MAAEVGGMSDERLCACACHGLWSLSSCPHCRVIVAGGGDGVIRPRVEEAAPSSTDERLCVRCGKEQSSYDHDPERHPLCLMDWTPPWACSLHPFEEAPSTDEGEARKGHECDAWCVFQSWVSEIRGGASNTDDLGLRSAFDAIAAEAREPLEERIRHLEAQLDEERAFADQYKRHAETGRAEAERLRGALRPLVAAYDGGDLECPHFHFCPAHRDRVRNGGPCNCGAGEIEAAIENARALTTPPSSTEGTKEVGG